LTRNHIRSRSGPVGGSRGGPRPFSVSRPPSSHSMTYVARAGRAVWIAGPVRRFIAQSGIYHSPGASPFRASRVGTDRQYVMQAAALGRQPRAKKQKLKLAGITHARTLAPSLAKGEKIPRPPEDKGWIFPHPGRLLDGRTDGHSWKHAVDSLLHASCDPPARLHTGRSLAGPTAGRTHTGRGWAGCCASGGSRSDARWHAHSPTSRWPHTSVLSVGGDQRERTRPESRVPALLPPLVARGS